MRARTGTDDARRRVMRVPIGAVAVIATVAMTVGALPGRAGAVVHQRVVEDPTATTVAVGPYPRSVTVDATAHVAYVLNSGNDQAVHGNGSLSVLQGTTVTTTKVGGTPTGSDVDPTTGVLYMLVYNTTDHLVEMSGGVVIRRIVVDTPVAVAVNPTNHVVYVLLATHQLDEIVGDQVTTIPVAGAFPDELAVDPGTGAVYVLSADGLLSVIRGSSTTVMRTGPSAMQLAVDTTSHVVYITHGVHARRHVILDARLTILRGVFLSDVDLGDVQPSALAVNPTTGTAYVTLSSVNSTAFGELVEVVGTTAKIVQVGGRPDAVAVDSASGLVYVANQTDGTVSVVSGKHVTATVATGDWPTAIAVDPSAGVAYVVNFLGDSVTELTAAS